MADNKKLDELVKIRKEKRQTLKDSGVNPYPHYYNPNSSVENILKEEKKLIASNALVSIAGRIVSIRQMGKALFINIQGEYDRLQCYVSNKNMDINEDSYMTITNNIDIGDIVGVEGEMFYTKTNEYTLRSHNFTLLSKSIRPLPNLKEKGGESFNSFDDKELRYRNRHLDLIVNPSVKDVFIIRSRIINEIRNFLNKRNYLEVETPILQPIYGGAFAKPFKTSHNALNQQLYLRIANELYLKRLIIGGYHKVYEIGKDFRNEGIDTSHNPEFTMLEFYQAYADVYIMATLVENMIKQVANKLNLKNILFKRKNINLNKKFKKIKFYDAISNICNEDIKEYSQNELNNFVISHNLDISSKLPKSKLLEKIFEL